LFFSGLFIDEFPMRLVFPYDEGPNKVRETEKKKGKRETHTIAAY
jgi:hypothetical protein